MPSSGLSAGVESRYPELGVPLPRVPVRSGRSSAGRSRPRGPIFQLIVKRLFPQNKNLERAIRKGRRFLMKTKIAGPQLLLQTCDHPAPILGECQKQSTLQNNYQKTRCKLVSSSSIAYHQLLPSYRVAPAASQRLRSPALHRCPSRRKHLFCIPMPLTHPILQPYLLFMPRSCG